VRITLAETAGFCMGVRRAVELVLDAPGQHPEPIYTYGPLIHNPQVLAFLEEKGIQPLKEIPPKGTGTVLIRAHGVPPQSIQALSDAGFQVINATCPRVIRVQSIIKRHARTGHTTIIVGDRDHPEVVGLLGHAGPDGVIVPDFESLTALPAFDKAVIVAQTTQNRDLYNRIKRWVGRHQPDYLVFDTICDSTEKRQAEAKRLSAMADAVVIVGGRNSGNTQRLAQIARQSGKPAYHVETDSELRPEMFQGVDHVGITAGASTPTWVINRVYRRIDNLLVGKELSARRVLFVLRRALLLTNIYVAVGAGCLTDACMRLLGLEFEKRLPFAAVAALYVLSMHMINNLIQSKTDRFNDPGRAFFYRQYRLPLIVLAIAAGAGGIMTAAALGLAPFILLLAMSALGLIYNMPLTPGQGIFNRYRRLRDLPGAKTVLISLAWAVAAVMLPALAMGTIAINQVGTVFAWCVGLVFARTAFFDILDIQGDRMLGKETIPLVFGEAATVRFLKRLLLLLPVMMALAVSLGWVPGLGVMLACCPLLLFGLIRVYEKKRIFAGTRLEFMVESTFILAGVLSIIWGLIT
jgi:4-hydroxy-3-methylbut-2-enyl diphosphate reductase